jgi:pimeloyl-ACP methyl ester carboxylesterase
MPAVMSQPSPPMPIEPFSVRVAAEVLVDLRARIRNTRWPDPAPGLAWEQGTDLAYLRQVLAYWADEFDWRAQERHLNTFGQFRAELDGVRIHFVHQRARGGQGLPLILTHGWPSTFVELLPLVPLLTDPQAHGIDGPAFDVVIPSLPGYGFSERPARTGVNYRYVAGLWHRLMRGLGYQRYGAQGGDFGAGVATFMALDDPKPMLGVHLSTLEIGPYTGPETRPLSQAEHAYLEAMRRWERTEGGYKAIQATRPQTLGYGLTDSPAGLLAWNAELWTGWGDHAEYLDVDTYLTHVCLYWFTRTAVSAARHYYEDAHSGAGYREAPNKVPTAVAVFPQDFRTVRAFAERSNNVVRYTEFERGGHFAYTTDPDLVVADLREFFGSLA